MSFANAAETGSSAARIPLDISGVWELHYDSLSSANIMWRQGWSRETYALEEWCDSGDPLQRQSIVPPKQD